MPGNCRLFLLPFLQVSPVDDIALRSDMTVELIDNLGSDDRIAQAARVQRDYDEPVGDRKRVAGLIGYMMRNKHGSPFEVGQMTFLVEAPLFTIAQFQRHRIGWSYSQDSARWRECKPVFWVPGPDREYMKVPGSKPTEPQFAAEDDGNQSLTLADMRDVYEVAWECYSQHIAAGIASEVARAMLPQAIYSGMYVTCNPRSLCAFLSLRTKRDNAKFPSHPQREIEEVAEKMEAIFARLFPLTHSAFDEYGRVAP